MAPVLDADLVTKADNKDTARCQLEMLKRANKLENTVLKEVNKAKKRALKDEAVRQRHGTRGEAAGCFLLERARSTGPRDMLAKGGRQEVRCSAGPSR